MYNSLGNEDDRIGAAKVNVDDSDRAPTLVNKLSSATDGGLDGNVDVGKSCESLE